LGPEKIRENPRFQDLTEIGYEFKTAYGEDAEIFYAAEIHDEKEMLFYEKGIAKLIVDGDESFLVREKILAFGKSPLELCRHNARKLTDLSTAVNQHLIVTSYLPQSYLEALIQPNCVITSSDSGLNVIRMQEGSLLGRNDGQIEALTAKELPSCSFFREAVEKIIMDQMAIPKVLPNVLKLEPRKRPKDPEKGMIIFNETTNNFEKFDGFRWSPF
jgi:hypothetical protein